MSCIPDTLNNRHILIILVALGFDEDWNVLMNLLNKRSKSYSDVERTPVVTVSLSDWLKSLSLNLLCSRGERRGQS